MNLLIYQRLLFLPLVLVAANSLQICSKNNNNETTTLSSVCPTDNTCCGVSAGCISSNMGSLNATCCSEDEGGGGCPKGYECSGNSSCLVTSARPFDPLLQTLPRYTLCPSNASYYKIYGLPLQIHSSSRTPKTLLLPYFSSHGPLVSTLSSKIRLVIVVVHGGARNADDYYCPLLAARNSLQTSYHQEEEVLIVAPRFLTKHDHIGEKDHCDPNATAWLRFGGTGHGKWRYGAAAINAAAKDNDYTSFDALDRVIEHLRYITNDDCSIVVTGHSVGAQYVQRWSVLTNVEWKSSIRAVIMNPSSWTYLTPYRKIRDDWKIPTIRCLNYNSWPWGLEPEEHHKNMKKSFQSPYFDRVMQTSDIGHIIERYKSRQIYYLAGALDRCNMTGKFQWCQSHDLGTSCNDELQGNSRWVRAHRFVESLRISNITTQHTFLAVPNVGHDHAMMFTSPVGVSVLFPPAKEKVKRANESTKMMDFPHHSLSARFMRLVKVFVRSRLALMQAISGLLGS
jgi:hypothetical protein